MKKQFVHEESIQLFSSLAIAFKSVIRRVWGTGEHFELSGPQFGLLMKLRHTGPMSPTELSESLLVTAGNITGIIARLQKQKLVERRRSSSDRRSIRIALTPTGLERIEQISPWWKKQVDGCFQEFSSQEKKELTALLKRLCSFLNPDEVSPCHKGDKA